MLANTFGGAYLVGRQRCCGRAPHCWGSRAPLAGSHFAAAPSALLFSVHYVPCPCWIVCMLSLVR